MNHIQWGLIVIFLLFVPEDWSRWRGPFGNSVSMEGGWDEKALERGANILWKSRVGAGYSAICVKNKRCYTMGNSQGEDAILCMDGETGKKVWEFSYPYKPRSYGGPFSTPVCDNGLLYALSRKGDLFCLKARTGEKVWQVDIAKDCGALEPKYGFSSSPVIYKNMLLLNACQHGLALHKQTGKKIWASPPGRNGYATPVIYEWDNRVCAAIFAHQRIHGVDIETGQSLWSFPWVFDDGACSADPVVTGSKVFISSAYRNGATVIDFSNNPPKQCWFKKEIQDEFGSSLYLNGYLYTPHGDTRHRTSYLKCIEFNTGQEMWRRDTGHCSLILVDHKFILLNQWGELTVMEASHKGYKDLCKAKVVKTSSRERCWTAPAFSNGRIYIRTSKGTLVCVDMRKKNRSPDPGSGF